MTYHHCRMMTEIRVIDSEMSVFWGGEKAEKDPKIKHWHPILKDTKIVVDLTLEDQNRTVKTRRIVNIWNVNRRIRNHRIANLRILNRQITNRPTENRSTANATDLQTYLQSKLRLKHRAESSQSNLKKSTAAIPTTSNLHHYLQQSHSKSKNHPLKNHVKKAKIAHLQTKIRKK